MTASVEFKALQSRLATAQEAERLATEEITSARKKLKEAKAKKQQLSDQLNNLRDKEVIVTEHAMVRYLERIVGLDTEEVRDRILPKAMKEQARWMGKGRITHDGMVIVIKDNAIVTVLPE